MLLSLAVRIALSSLSYPTAETDNHDLWAYDHVTDIFLTGNNVYNETEKYNYAPGWLLIITAIKLSGLDLGVGTGILLGLVDALISLLLFHRLGLTVAAYLYLLSPVTIFISGTNLQFNNMALLPALLAVLYVRRVSGEKEVDSMSLWQTSIFAAIIGISLFLKHLLFIYPVWLFFKSSRPTSEVALLVIPPLLFGLSFIPFSGDGLEGIVNNVIGYQPINNAPLFFLLMPKWLIDFNATHDLGLTRVLFFSAVITLGYLFRKRPLLENLMLYLSVIFIFSPSIVISYMSIAMLLTVVYPNAFHLLFHLFALLHFSVFLLYYKIPEAVS